jgi:hypothetical protein
LVVVTSEQAVLLAVLEEDRVDAERRLDDYLPSELRGLEIACNRLAFLARRALRLKEHEAGDHANMAFTGPRNSFGDRRSGTIDTSVFGCPKCHKISGIRMPTGGWDG